MLKQEFTIIIYCENNTGLLNRIAILFSRRRLQMQSLNVAASALDGVHRFTIVATDTETEIKKLVQQISKQAEVLHCGYYSADMIVWREQAFYRLRDEPANLEVLEQVLNDFGARHLFAEDGLVITATGSGEELHALLLQLQPLGLDSFVSSGRVAVSLREDQPHQRLKTFAAMYPRSEIS